MFLRIATTLKFSLCTPNFWCNSLLFALLAHEYIQKTHVFSEARKRKLRKLILPILLFLKLKAAIIVPAVLSFIALVAFKGLGASLVALLIAGATAFKGILADNRAPRVSYEVVPQLSAHLWNRAGIDDLSLGSGYHTIP